MSGRTFGDVAAANEQFLTNENDVSHDAVDHVTRF